MKESRVVSPQWMSYELPLDGFHLSVNNLVDATEELASSKNYNKGRPVVLLCAGFANHVSVLDIAGEDSLPRYLFKAGYDVWTFDLRGHGKSTVPLSSDGWSLSTYVFYDAVNVIKFVLNRTGPSKLHWIGHSMGGMIGLALSCYRATSSLISSVTAVASSIYFQHSIYWWFLNLSPAYPIAVCSGWLDLSLFFCCTGWFLPICGCGEMVASTQNTGYQRLNDMLHNSFGKEPMGVVNELKTGFSSCGLILKVPKDCADIADVNDNNTTNTDSSVFILRDLIGKHPVPICLVYGLEDSQIAACDVEEFAEEVKGNMKSNGINPEEFLTIKAVGKMAGTEFPYNHYDLISGQSAHRDVYPVILDFLRKERS